MGAHRESACRSLARHLLFSLLSGRSFDTNASGLEISIRDPAAKLPFHGSRRRLTAEAFTTETPHNQFVPAESATVPHRVTGNG
jgi:hypothetical protein